LRFELFFAHRLSTRKGSGLSQRVLRIGVTAVAISMVVMIISIATGLGLQRRITEKITSFTGHLQIVPYIGPEDREKPLISADSIREVLMLDPDVAFVQGVSEKGGILKTEIDFEGVMVKGLDSSFNWGGFEQYLRSGVLPNYTGEDYNDAILISDYLLNRLQLKLGDTVAVFFIREASKPPLIRKFTLCGTYSTGMETFDKEYILADHKHLSRILKWQKGDYGHLEIFLKEDAKVLEVTDRWIAKLPLYADTYTARERYPDIYQWVGLFDVNIYFILLIMILVGMVNTMTALITIILEKKKAIGLLKALGASNQQLRELFRYRSIHILLQGLFWGNTIGIGLCLLQKHFEWIKLDPEIYYVSSVPIELNLWILLSLNLVIIAIGFLSMSLPVRIIGKMDPAEALRTF